MNGDGGRAWDVGLAELRAVDRASYHYVGADAPSCLPLPIVIVPVVN